MNKTVIVDYGLCNLNSISRAIEVCGGNPVVTSNAEDLASADRIILPGVGAFPDAMANLRERGLVKSLYQKALVDRVPFLGICLGMQLIAVVGNEVKRTLGLGWIDGEVELLKPADSERIPHVGWNEVHYVPGCRLFAGIPQDSDFYFVHSFHFRTKDQASIAGVTNYASGFTSVVNQGLVFGVQFHPEKSQKHGLALLKNFLTI